MRIGEYLYSGCIYVSDVLKTGTCCHVSILLLNQTSSGTRKVPDLISLELLNISCFQDIFFYSSSSFRMLEFYLNALWLLYLLAICLFIFSLAVNHISFYLSEV